jgi:hypothetical protein
VRSSRHVVLQKDAPALQHVKTIWAAEKRQLKKILVPQLQQYFID